MKIGIISDTHNIIPSVASAFNIFFSQHTDLIIHCGDWINIEMINFISKESKIRKIPIKGVFGNRDDDHLKTFYLNTKPKNSIDLTIHDYLDFEIEDKRYVITHGHKRNILEEFIASQQYSVIFTGHTHKPNIETVNNTIIINPGSTAFSIPRRKIFNPSISIFETSMNYAKIIYI